MELIITRGLPGSGKTTFVKRRYQQELLAGTAEYCSTDDAFMDGENYRYDPSRIGEAVNTCRRKAIRAMRCSMPIVIVDNTHTRLWEWSEYVEHAVYYGYTVRIFEFESSRRLSYSMLSQINVHNVPENKIQQMAERWEYVPKPLTFESLGIAQPVMQSPGLMANRYRFKKYGDPSVTVYYCEVPFDEQNKGKPLKDLLDIEIVIPLTA